MATAVLESVNVGQVREQKEARRRAAQPPNPSCAARADALLVHVLTGWAGRACESLSCALDCGAHGKCTGGVCVCAHGWTGDRCDVEERVCVDASCGWPHGACAANGTCVCAPGWRGRACDERACDCSGHGVCTASGGCLCTGGWSGAACDVPPCPGLPACSDRGRCLPPSADNGYAPTCECYGGYSGAACELAVGCAAGCGEHGSCEHGVCVCIYSLVTSNKAFSLLTRK